MEGAMEGAMADDVIWTESEVTGSRKTVGGSLTGDWFDWTHLSEPAESGVLKTDWLELAGELMCVLIDSVSMGDVTGSSCDRAWLESARVGFEAGGGELDFGGEGLSQLGRLKSGTGQVDGVD
jgi:hypothetical protein